MSKVIKRVTFSFIVFLFFAISSVFAQASVDIIYLKNGSVIRGKIVEEKPGVSYKIQTKDGSVFVYKIEEVEKIEYGARGTVTGERLSPGVSLILSLIVYPGVGQFYNGDIGSGFVYLGWATGSLVVIAAGSSESNDTATGIGVISYLTAYVVSGITAYKSAKRHNRERGYAINLLENPSLLNIDGGKLSLGIPQPQIKLSRLENGKKYRSYNVNLLKVSF